MVAQNSIPPYKAASDRRVAGKHNAIDLFVSSYEPPGDAEPWRRALLDVYNHAWDEGLNMGLAQGRLQEAKESLQSETASAKRALSWMKILIVIGSFLYLLFGLFLLITIVAFAWRIILS